MDRLGVQYDTVDITKDPDALEKILSMGFKSAPVVITDNDAWSGFNPDKVGQLAA